MGMVSKAEGQVFSVERLSTKWVYDANGKMVEVMPDQLAHDYDPETGEYRGILIEPESTNILEKGNRSPSYYQSPPSRVSDYKAPDGSTDAHEMEQDSSLDTKGYYYWSGNGVSKVALEGKEGKKVTASGHIKRISGSERYRVGWPSAAMVNIDLIDQSISSMDDAFDARLTSLADDWFRYEFSWTVTRGLTAQEFHFRPYIAEDAAHFLIWGHQWEVGGGTSYTGANGSPATRPADVVTFDNTGPHYNPSQGTWVVDIDSDGSNALVGVGADTAKLTGKGTFVYAYDENGGEGYAGGESVFTTLPLKGRPELVSLGDQRSPVRIRNIRYLPYRMPSSEAKETAVGAMVADYLFSGDLTLSLDNQAKIYAAQSRQNALDVSYSESHPFSVERLSTKWVTGADGKMTEVMPDQLAYDHDPVTGARRGVLIEPESTNLALGSELSGSVGLEVGNGMKVSESAYWLIPGHNLYRLEGVEGPNRYLAKYVGTGFTGTESVYVKSDGTDAQVNLRWRDTDDAASVVWALRSDGGLEVVSAVGDQLIDFGDQYIGDGIYRLWVTASTTDEAKNIRIQLPVQGHSALFAGWQIETTLSPTSYIPTDSSQVTRPADAVTFDNSGEHYNPSQGTWIMDVDSVGGNALVGIGAGTAKLTGKGAFVYTYDEDGGEAYAAGENVFTTPRLGSRPTELSLGDQKAPIHVGGVRYFPYRMAADEAKGRATGSVVVDHLFSEGQSLVLDFLARDFGRRGYSDALDVTRSSELTDVVEFTRTTSATYFDSLGRMWEAGPDEPRFDHNPVTKESLGLLLEAEKTNILRYTVPDSETPTGWTNSSSAPGSRSLYTMSNGMIGIRFTTDMERAHLNAISPPIQPNTTYTMSAYIEILSGKLPLLALLLVGGPQGTEIDGQPIAKASWMQPDGRISMTFTTGDSVEGIYIRYGIGTQNVDSGDIVISGVQLEEGESATSFIPTYDVPVTRASDNARVPAGDHTHPSAGTWFADVRDVLPMGANGIISHSATARAIYRLNSNNGGVYRAYNGSTAFNFPVAHSVEDYNKVASSYSASSFSAAVNATSDSSPLDTSSLMGVKDTHIGSYDGVNGQLNRGHLKRIEYYPRAMSEAELQALTT